MNWDQIWKTTFYDEEDSFGSGYRRYDDYKTPTNKPKAPDTYSKGIWGGTHYEYNTSVKYKHKGNNVWYYPTTCGRWVPVPGQGLEIYPRTLNESYLEGYQSSTFKIGDIVRLKTGTAPIRIEAVTKSFFTGEYVSSGTRIVARSTNDIVLHEDYNNIETDGETKMADTKTLYEIKLSLIEEPVYGHYLATNSSGQWVMEQKGTGKIHTVDKADVQEVLPYTIGVQFISDGGVGKTYSYFADKDKYQVGQVFVMGNSLVTVVDVDTKSKSATKDFKPTVEILTKKVD